MMLLLMAKRILRDGLSKHAALLCKRGNVYMCGNVEKGFAAVWLGEKFVSEFSCGVCTLTAPSYTNNDDDDDPFT